MKLLNSTLVSVDTCFDYSEELIAYFSELPKDADERKDFYLKNPPPYPDYLNTFMAQHSVSKNLSATTLNGLNEFIINLERTRSNNAPLYLELLSQTLRLLELEVAYQEGQLSESSLNKKLGEIKQSRLSSERAKALNVTHKV